MLLVRRSYTLPSQLCMYVGSVLQLCVYAGSVLHWARRLLDGNPHDKSAAGARVSLCVHGLAYMCQASHE